MLDVATRALRAGSIPDLRDGMVRALFASEASFQRDDRDLMVALAPAHDCVRRLGGDPAQVFADVAAAGPPALAETVRTFGRRADVTPSAFGFELRPGPRGPGVRVGPIVGLAQRAGTR